MYKGHRNGHLTTRSLLNDIPIIELETTFSNPNLNNNTYKKSDNETGGITIPSFASVGIISTKGTFTSTLIGTGTKITSGQTLNLFFQFSFWLEVIRIGSLMLLHLIKTLIRKLFGWFQRK